jgi:hypothetical protein
MQAHTKAQARRPCTHARRATHPTRVRARAVLISVAESDKLRGLVATLKKRLQPQEPLTPWGQRGDHGPPGGARHWPGPQGAGQAANGGGPAGGPGGGLSGGGASQPHTPPPSATGASGNQGGAGPFGGQGAGGSGGGGGGQQGGPADGGGARADGGGGACWGGGGGPPPLEPWQVELQAIAAQQQAAADGGRPEGMPFELRALEVCLEQVRARVWGGGGGSGGDGRPEGKQILPAP